MTKNNHDLGKLDLKSGGAGGQVYEGKHDITKDNHGLGKPDLNSGGADGQVEQTRHRPHSP